MKLLDWLPRTAQRRGYRINQMSVGHATSYNALAALIHLNHHLSLQPLEHLRNQRRFASGVRNGQPFAAIAYSLV